MHIVWFRRDLRTLDNPALRGAIQSREPVIAVYIATPEQWRRQHLAPIQADLIFCRLFALQTELGKLNIPLLYAETADYAQGIKAVTELAARLGARNIFANREYELNEQRRDRELASLAEARGITTGFYHDRCLLPPGSVLTKEQRYFKVFTPFKRKWLQEFSSLPVTVAQPERACAIPENMLVDGLQDSAFTLFHSAAPFRYPRTTSAEYCSETSPILEQLKRYCLAKLSSYAAERDFPAISGTSRLSPYLAIGALSVRQCIAAMWDVQGDVFDNGAETWLNEFIWREFYQHLSALEPRVSRQRPFHPWAEQLLWHDNREWFEKWKWGETGYPIVDAAMRQLKQTGWMHNRLRMVVASFLVKDLHIDWRWGEDYFMRQLVDGDFASNNGGWQWSASTGCDGQPYFRIFNPVSQGEKFDPAGRFVRAWLPELAAVPDRYIHKPWQWNGFAGLNYCPPLVDHKQERTIALTMYQNARDMYQNSMGIYQERKKESTG